MFDCHNDLLTYIYQKRNNVKFLQEYCSNIYNSNNITGAIFNLFFMSPEEMYSELGFLEAELNTIQMLQHVINIINSYSLIPTHINYLLGIEGLDYINSLNDIDKLYDLGIRCITVVWNNQNKFGSGNRSSNGLTKLGKQLIHKLVDMHIAIDLSHANTQTFFDIIELCNELKQHGKHPIIFASHSNCTTVYNTSRNLTDEQIQAIAQLDGIIGLVQIKRFCSHLDMKNLSNINDDFTR